MKNLRLLLLSLFILEMQPAHAIYSETADFYEFDPAELNVPNRINYSNRAACALDSQEPTQSAFLIVDSYNAGKQIDSWLQGTDFTKTFDLTVEQGLKIFRLSLAETWMTITQEILNGRLPLLKANADNRKIEANYSKILNQCGKRFPCPEMDQYLSEIFAAWKAIPKDASNAYRSYFELDKFAKRPELLKGRSKPQSSCLYIKRFSELQSNLNHDRPDQALLQKIALASLAKNDLFTDCFDESDSISSRRFMLQLDISEASKSNWKKYGFDFWYSVKLYFSYAWRHPEIILESVHPLNNLFKDLAIEQMIHLVSSGCKSIDRPECTQSQVSMDIFRSLGKMGAATELDRPLPDRPEQVLIRDTLSLNHGDSAILPEHEETDLWLKGYQERIIQRRGLLKQRLLLAMSQFELLSSSITSDRVSKELTSLKSKMNEDPLVYQKMQVLCTEIDIAVRPDVNLLEKRFETTLQISKFKHLVESSTDQQLGGMLDFYKSIAKTTFPICEQIRIEKLWKQDTVVATQNYSAWYRDLSGTWDAPVPKPDGTNAPDFIGMGQIFNQLSPGSKTFLIQEKISKEGTKEISTVCADASDCVRMLLKSMVDLYAVSAWSDAIMPMNEWIQSPSLANPWASATACKVYDPWFATKQALVGLVTDLSTTVVTGFAPIPAYLAVQLKHRDVKAFELAPRGDEIFLKPVKKGAGADVTAGVDLGPWIGIPCAATFSPTSNRPQIGGYYSVAGVRAEACTGKDNNRLIVNESSSPGVNQKHTYSGCAMCYLNPYSAIRGAATIASFGIPAAKIAVGALFSGINFAKKLTNPIDVPHRYKVDLDDVSNTFEKYSFIPKHCVRRLSKGKACRNAILTKSERKDYRE